MGKPPDVGAAAVYFASDEAEWVSGAVLLVSGGAVVTSDPYRYLQIRGRVVDETEEGAYDVICDLRLKYRGDRNYPKNPGEVRVTYRVLPEQAFPKK